MYPKAESPPRSLLTGANPASDDYRLNRTDYEIAKEELNYFYQFKSSSLYQEYLLYHLNTKPFSSVFFLLIIDSLVFLPATTLSLTLYAQIDSPERGYILVGVFLVLSSLFSSIIGSLYVIERIFPKWKVYKKCLLLFRRCQRRYAKVYTTGSALARSKSTLSFRAEPILSSSDPTPANNVQNEDEEEEEEENSLKGSICYSGRNSYQDKKIVQNSYGSMSKKIIILQQIFLFLVMMVNILFFVHSGIQQNCHDYGNGPLNALFRRCGNLQPVEGDGPKLDVYPILFMLTPVIVSCIFRELLFELQIANHFVVVSLALIATAVNSQSKLTMGLLGGWMIGGYFVLLDLHTHNVAAFLTSYKLREILLEKERNADRAAATEMRHMIGNVAHDLKTPLASFTTGLEIIADIIETNEKAIHIIMQDQCSSNVRTDPSFPSKESSSAIPRINNVNHYNSPSSNKFTHSPHSNKNKLFSRAFNFPANDHVNGLLENNQGIKHCLQNIRDTNTFMLMTINRCIDYTKASRGFKLVPKYETLDLLETLRLPLDCMKNIQERIQIALKPIDMKEICSHIITDKQWLQENLLCLLSNAVKYSTGGEVTIAVYLTKMQIQSKEVTHTSVQEKPDVAHDSDYSNTLSFLSDRWGHQFSQTLFGLRRFSSVISSKPSAATSSDRMDGKISENEDCSVPSLSHSLNSTREDFTPVGRTASSFMTRQKSRLYNIDEGNEKSITQRIDSGAREAKQEKDVSPLTPSNPSSALHYIRFDVEDTGIGMSTEAMGQLFSPFRQAQRLAGGTGLGLYSLAKRVEALNGSYGVMKRSDGKKGSLFWFAIPYRPDFTTADAFSDPLVDQSVDNPDSSNKPEGRIKLLTEDSPGVLKRRKSLEFGIIDFKLPKLHILLVDDSPSIVKMSSMMLKRQGHVIEIADNGENALQRIQNQWMNTQRGFDIILMDLQMPVMDGLEATRRLRSLERESPSWLRPQSFEGKSEGSSLGAGANKLGQLHEAWSRSFPSHSYHHAVIGVSANSDDETAREAIEAGVDAFLPKPFSMDLFNSTAIKIMSKILDSYEDE